MRRGFSLAQVLMVAAVALTAAFSMAALTSSHLNLSQRYTNGVEAQYLAEAAIAEAIGRIQDQPTYGKTRAMVTLDPAPDRWGKVSFDPGERQVPLSQNNLEEDGSEGTARLVGVGFCRGTRREVEVLLSVPPYIYAVATAGSIVSQEGLEVRTVDPARQAACHIASNSAIRASGRFFVSGDVIAQTQDLPDDAVVQGRRVLDAEDVDLPNLSIDDWDPRNDSALAGYLTELEPSIGDAVFQGPYITSPENDGGDLTVTGNLKLDKALVFVQGDLTVRGRIVGQGALVVKGRTNILGAVDVASVSAEGSKVAMLAEGDVTISGSEPKNQFHGLVYSRGGMDIRKVDIVGSLVQAPVAGDPPGVSLRDVRIDLSTESSKMTVQVQTPRITAGSMLLDGMPDRTLHDSELRAPGRSPQVVQLLREARDDMDAEIYALYAGKPYRPLDVFERSRTDGGLVPSAVSIPMPNWESRLRPGMMGGETELSTILSRERGQPLQLDVYVVRNDGTMEFEDQHLQVGSDGFFELADFNQVRPEIRGIIARPTGNDGQYTQDHYYYLNSQEVGRILEEYLGGDRRMELALHAVQAQAIVRDVGNRHLRRSPMGPGRPPLNWSRELDLNRFLQKRSPIRVLGWRER